MSKKKTTLISNSMQYGAMIGISLFIVFILANLAGESKGLAVLFGLLNLAIWITGIVLGTINYRENVLKGRLTYSQGLKSGTLIGFFGAIIMVFVLFIYVRFIDETPLINMKTAQEKEYINQGLTDEQLDKVMAYVGWMSTPFGYALINLIVSTIAAFIISLITSAVLKKGNDTFEDFMAENR